jgi:predicted esterase
MSLKGVHSLFVAILVTVVCTTLSGGIAAQQWTEVRFSESPAVIKPAVSYVPQAPVIDGLLDERLKDLPTRQFSIIWKSNPDNRAVPASYRLAYGSHFLYVYVEAEADELTYRDRAYQNGDGFTVVLTVPQPDNAPSEEFYVLACSAVNRKRMEWSRKVFWYYNVDNIFLPTSDDMEMEFRDGDGTIHFELLLPWQDVHPYHPWLSEGIGFNLGMTKAIGDNERNLYKVVDAGIGSENSPREYALLQFEKPQHEGEPQTFVRLARSNIWEGDTLLAQAVTIAERPLTEKLTLVLKSGERTTIDHTREEYGCHAGVTQEEIDIGSSDLPAGGYVVKWSSDASDGDGEAGLTVLPPYDAQALERRLEKVKGALAAGSFVTFQFTIEEIGKELAEVYPYETNAASRIKLSRLLNYFAVAEQGQDVFAQRRGFVRMAYRSELDDTLQPYVVYLPEDFDPAQKYPLVVYLHGSASTERDVVGWQGLPDGFIAVGPKGRGPSNWYSWDNAQTDIAEAVKAVAENFPIDKDKILLAGFSMGGYGVYRTFYENPDTYRAIAVFSGMPKIRFGAPEGKDLIDFNDEKHLKLFQGVPVFVFHGKRDRNVPFADTDTFIAKLERAGAQVEFHTEEDTGHESPNEETVAAFHRWIARVIAN